MTGTWGHMTACELGREIGKGRIHPVELAEAFEVLRWVMPL